MTSSGRMRIEPYALALADPLETAGATIDERAGFLVGIEADGEPGVGEAAPLPGWTESVDACRAALERAVEIGERDGWAAALDGLSSTPAARHGVALALADARARADEQPLYRHLGGDRRVESLPVNATIGDGTAAETGAAARRAVDHGFDCLKVKAGARPLAEDRERVRAVREAVGDGVELRLDANGAWDRTEARRALAAVAEYDVTYVEQPLPADDLQGHAALRDGPVEVALDESVATAGIDAVLAANAADVVVLKPVPMGGPDRARSAARRAVTEGVDPVLSTTVDAVYARTAAVHVAASLPALPASGLATADRLAEDLAPDPAPVRDGEIEVPQGPGTGVEPPTAANGGTATDGGNY